MKALSEKQSMKPLRVPPGPGSAWVVDELLLGRGDQTGSGFAGAKYLSPVWEQAVYREKAKHKGCQASLPICQINLMPARVILSFFGINGRLKYLEL